MHVKAADLGTVLYRRWLMEFADGEDRTGAPARDRPACRCHRRGFPRRLPYRPCPAPLSTSRAGSRWSGTRSIFLTTVRPLSKEIPDGGGAAGGNAYFRERDFFDVMDIELRLGSAVVGLDGDGRAVTLASGERIGYDTAVIATGARPRHLPGTEGLPGVHVMRTLDDSTAILSALDHADHVVVVGAGFIGSEVASSARNRGGGRDGSRGGRPASGGGDRRRRRGNAARPCTVSTGPNSGAAPVWKASTGPPDGLAVRVDGGTTVGCDLVVVGIGVIPNIEWLDGSGGRDRSGGGGATGTCARRCPMCTRWGDVASWHNARYGEQMRVEHWTNTVQQATAVARNILAFVAGDDPVAYDGIPYFWSDQYGHRLQLVGRASEDEPVFVHDPPDSPAMMALYRDGDRLGGAFAIDAAGPLMQMRGLLLRNAGFDEALDLTAGLE